MSTSKDKIEWTGLERRTFGHTPDWYWAVGIIAASIATTSYILDNVLFAVFVVIAVTALFLRTLQKPRMHSYALTSKGLWINREFYSFKTIDSFWIDETASPPTLLLKSRELLVPLLVLPLEDIDHEALRAYLIMILPEIELHEPFSKKLMEFLGF